jgi:hypothetical protein
MAEKETVDLGKTSEGYAIEKTSVKVLKLGDGLSAAVKVDPVLVGAGETVYLAIRAKKIKDDFVYEFDEDGDVESVTLVQVFAASSATFIDEKVVRQAIARSDALIAASKVNPDQGAMLRTCGACGWREGEAEGEFCVGGSPLHDFPTTLIEDDEDEEDGD